MKKWEQFKAWDERFESNHPIAHGILTAVCGIGAIAVATTLALIGWAVQ
jgi:hypothetical protein